MSVAASKSYNVLVDNLLLMSSSVTVFSGPNQNEQRVRVVIEERLSPVAGEVYEVHGKWCYHEKHGRQFHAVSHRRIRLSGKLIIPFLQHRLKGVGPARARRLYDAFNDNLGKVLTDPKRIMEVARAMSRTSQISDYSVRLAVMVHYQWGGQEAEYQTLRWLEDRGIDNPSTGRLVARILGKNAPEVLEKNPYILSATISWHRMDQIGLPILRVKPECKSAYRAPERLLGATDSVMRDVIARGHTAVDKELFREKLNEKLRQNDQVVDEAIRLAELNGAVVNSGAYWRAPGCCYMEDSLSRRIAGMISGSERTALQSLAPAKIRSVLNNAMVRKNLTLHAEQQAAILSVLDRQLSILTGGAGTGKTTVVNFIADVWEHMGGRVEMAALAGKAALRMSQTSSRLARTIFRTVKGLEKRLDGDKGADLPMLDDKTLLIIDEASMVDLGQWHQIIEMMPEGCRLLMVGDVAQLPPIGFGLVFQKLAVRPDIAFNLTKIHRQTDASGIPMVAAAIREARPPSFSSYAGLGPGVSFIDVKTKEVQSMVEKVANELGGFWKNDDLMICTSLNETEIGVIGINDLFSKKHQTLSGTEPVRGFLGNYFLPNDPVIFLRNDYKEGLFNGSMGRITDTDIYERKVTAIFDEEEKVFAGAELFDLKLAYAITCHKAQGSQAKRVIIPVTDSKRLDPTWLYTAVTRAEEQCVLVGDGSLLKKALMRLPAYEQRVVGFSG